MFTRSELEIKTLGELKGLCKQYGLKPLGNPAYKTAWIDALLNESSYCVASDEGRGRTDKNPHNVYQPLAAIDPSTHPLKL